MFKGEKFSICMKAILLFCHIYSMFIASENNFLNNGLFWVSIIIHLLYLEFYNKAVNVGYVAVDIISCKNKSDSNADNARPLLEYLSFEVNYIVFSGIMPYVIFGNFQIARKEILTFILVLVLAYKTLYEILKCAGINIHIIAAIPYLTIYVFYELLNNAVFGDFSSYYLIAVSISLIEFVARIFLLIKYYTKQSVSIE